MKPMPQPDPAADAAARAYEDLFVPALFMEWCPRLVEAAAIAPGDRVLDVACGTGVLARAAAKVVGPSGSVSGIDLAPGMLALASRLAPEVTFHHGPAEDLPFDAGAFDKVVSQFGLMFFRDRIQALREMRRVLRPGGRLAIAVWASLDDTPAYAAEVELLDRLAGSAAANALRAPFVLGNPEDVLSLVVRAGFADAAVRTVVGLGRFPGVRTLVEADLRGWLPLMGVVLPEPLIRTVLDEAEAALAPFVTSQGLVEFASPAHIVRASNGAK